MVLVATDEVDVCGSVTDHGSNPLLNQTLGAFQGFDFEPCADLNGESRLNWLEIDATIAKEVNLPDGWYFTTACDFAGTPGKKLNEAVKAKSRLQ